MSSEIQAFNDTHVGLVTESETTKQLPDGTWEASCPIGSIFGAAVEGKCTGVGPTKEAALAALEKDKRTLADSLWA